jgi:hypothetical protein
LFRLIWFQFHDDAGELIEHLASVEHFELALVSVETRRDAQMKPTHKRIQKTQEQGTASVMQHLAGRCPASSVAKLSPAMTTALARSISFGITALKTECFYTLST